MYKLKIFCGQGGNSDNFLSALPRTDTQILIQGQTNISSLPRLKKITYHRTGRTFLTPTHKEKTNPMWAALHCRDQRAATQYETHRTVQRMVLYAVRAIKRVPAGSCHFLCFTDPSQSVVSFPCIRKWEHIKTMCASIAWALALWLWSRHYSTRETEGFSGPPCPLGM